MKDYEKELMDLTETETPEEAIEAAIKFTLLHDKDSVQEALK